MAIRRIEFNSWVDAYDTKRDLRLESVAELEARKNGSYLLKVWNIPANEVESLTAYLSKLLSGADMVECCDPTSRSIFVLKPKPKVEGNDEASK